MNKVLLNTWSGAFFNEGGGEVQLKQTRNALLKKKYQVELFDQWNPQKNFSIFHQFSVQLGTSYQINEYKNLGKKIVVAPILWVDLKQDDFMFWYIRNNLVKSDKIFTNSNAESLKLSKDFDISFEKFHKTRNAIDLEYTNLETSFNFRNYYKIDNPFVLSVANIDQRKNTHRLIEVCKKIKIKPVLIGHIRDHNYFNSLNKNDFTYLGPINDINILKSAYQQCELFLLPSLCETPGIAALEAASQGAKIAITQEGCAKEYFSDFVSYCDPLSVDSIESACLNSLNNKKFNKNNFIEFITTQYTWDKTADDIINGYKQL